MENSTYARRTSETHSKRAPCALCTLGVRPMRVAVCRLKSVRVFFFLERLGSAFFKHAKNVFLKLGVSRACVLYVSNQFHVRYRRFECAWRTFEPHQYCCCNVPQACMRRAFNVSCAPVARTVQTYSKTWRLLYVGTRLSPH